MASIKWLRRDRNRMVGERRKRREKIAEWGKRVKALTGGVAKRNRQIAEKEGGGKVRIIPRSEWGARAPRGGLTPQTVVRECFVHHTVMPALPATATVAEESARMRQLQAFHQDSRGYTDIAYTTVVFPSGRVYEGRPKGYVGAHTMNHNSTGVAISFDGNFEESRPTPAALATARAVRKQIAPGCPVRPHSAVFATACPGKNLKAKLGEIA